MTTLQLGAALSEPLWDRIGPSGLVALRLVLAALILWPFARPVLRGRSREDLGAAVALGACSGRADPGVLRSDRPDPARCRRHDRVPRTARGRAGRLAPCARRRLGAAGRRRRRRCSRWATGPGSRSIPQGSRSPSSRRVCWAGYILLTKRVGARWAGLEGLSISLGVAALVVLPVGVAVAGTELLVPEVILAGAALALLTPLLPFVFELLALRRLPTALFGVIMSLEPAIAALLGFMVLDQALAVSGIVAIAMVSIASAGATLTSPGPAAPDEPVHAV